MAKLLGRLLPGCCSVSDPPEDPRLQLSLNIVNSLAAKVSNLEAKVETLESAVDDLQQHYSTAPTTPSRGRSPFRPRTLLKTEDNYLPALLEMLENSRCDYTRPGSP